VLSLVGRAFKHALILMPFGHCRRTLSVAPISGIILRLVARKVSVFNQDVIYMKQAIQSAADIPDPGIVPQKMETFWCQIAEALVPRTRDVWKAALGARL